MKFLFQFEDGGIKQADTLSSEDIESSMDGYLIIVKYENDMFWVLGNDGETWEEVDDNL